MRMRQQLDAPAGRKIAADGFAVCSNTVPFRSEADLTKSDSGYMLL